MRDYLHLIVNDTASVRTITLNRPDKLNAVNGELAASLGEALADAAVADEVRVVVITGAGRGFCAGLDLSEPPTLPSATRAERLDPYAWVGTWVQRVIGCEKPVVAAVNGAAAGAGFGLALACDIRIVAKGAKMSAGYARRALSPDAGVSYHLPRHIGLSRATELLLTGRDMDAEEALRIGLAMSVVPDDELLDAAQKFAGQLAQGAPIAQALTKRLLSHTFDASRDAQLREELTLIKQCVATSDVTEAMKAFREKRVPKFEGR